MTDEEKQFFVDLISGVEQRLSARTDDVESKLMEQIVGVESKVDAIHKELEITKTSLQKQIDVAQETSKNGLMLLQKEVRKYREEIRWTRHVVFGFNPGR